MNLYTRILTLASILFLFAGSPALAQTVPSTLRVGEVFSTSVAGRADLTLDFTDRDYELILYALKTTEDTTKTFRFTVSPPAAAKVAFIRALKAMEPDGRDRAEMALRAEERRIAEILRQNPYTPFKPAVAQAPAVGSQRQFAFRKFGGVKQDVTVTARLVAVSQKALAYADVDTAGLGRKAVTTAQIQAMLEEFDRTSYPTVTSVFGKESDVDGDGRVLFLFTRRVNEVGGIAGFYSTASALPASRGGNGNLSDMMYLSPDRAPGFYRSLLAHEFQHLVNFNQHVLARTGGESEDSWLNEGLSHLSEDLVGDHTLGGNNGLVETFLAHPERFSLTGEALLNLGVRGAAYLFVRGLVDQKGQGILGPLTQTGRAGPANVEAVMGQPFADLYRGWAARLFLSGTKLNGDPAYNHTFPYLTEATTGRRAVPPPREDALTAGGTPLSGALRPTGMTFVRLAGSGSSVRVQVSADTEGDVRALVIPVPKAFRPQLVAPVDFFEYLKLDAPLSSAQTAGVGFTISGGVMDPSVSKVMLRFARTDLPAQAGGADSLKFIAEVVNGRFSRPVVFAPSQAGTYVLAPFLLREGPLFDGTNAFGPVVVAASVTREVTLPADYFPGLRFDQAVSANRTTGTGFSLNGAATDPAIREVFFRFVRKDRPDSLRFFAEVAGGRFRRPVVFTPSQAGTYVFQVYARRGGPLYDYIDEFPEFAVKKGLTDDVILPADYFRGLTFDAPFPATITAGVGLRLAGGVADQTANRMLVNFAPAQGEGIQFGIDVQGGRFGQDVIFTPEQAGTYKVSFYLGQQGQSSFPYVDGFEPVVVRAVPGIKTAVPTGYFSGLTLDAPFPADVFIGKAVRFSGTVANSANTQVAVAFRSLEGGQDVPTVFINVSGGRFSRDLTLTQAGRYRMIVYAGVQGQSLPFVGQFDGVRVRAGQADIAVTVPRLDFGEVGTGGSKELTLTLYNRGTQALAVRDVTSSSPLLTATPRTATIAAGDSVRVTVTFRPTGAGDLAGTLTVLSDDTDEGSLAVSTVGRGLAQTVLTPAIAVSPTSLDFDSVRVGNVSRKTLTVSNTGNDTLRVTGAAISGADSAHFSASPTVFRVAPGGRQAVTVAFAPKSAGSKSASLSVAHNAAGSPSTVALTGVGTGAAGLAELIKVPVNGVDTYIYVQSSTPLDATNQKPLLLVLHGGPGYVMMGALARSNPSLLDAFVIVDWDQRGAGHSYVAAKNLDMKFDTFVSDAHDLTTYLIDRYKRQKVYILGHSYGTMIGLMLVAQYPQLYAGYIAVGFAGDVVRNERGSRDWALNEARRLGNATAIQELTAIGDPGPLANYPDYTTPVHGQTRGNLSGSAITIYWVGQFGGDVYGRTGTDEIEKEIRNSEIYKNIPWEEGWVYSQQVFEQSKLSDLDLWSRVKSVSAPVYFFQGVHDADTPYSLAKDFYNQLKVEGNGAKYWVDFENSAHFPFTEEPAKFSRELLSIVRGSTTSAAISLSVTALKFDSTTVGATSQKTLTIRNTGTASLSVTGIMVTGTDAAQFMASPATATVAAGDSAKVTVTFAPTSAGSKSASLSVAHNAAGSPTAVSLTGTGVAVAPPSRVGDFNGDAQVNFDDFFLFAAAFGTDRGKPGYDAKYDLDADGSVGFGDFFIFADRFGK